MTLALARVISKYVLYKMEGRQLDKMMEINISIVQMGYDRETYFFKRHYLADCLVHGYFTICLKNLLSICHVKEYLQV